MKNDAMLETARRLAAKAIKDAQKEVGVLQDADINAFDMYVVWFAKELQNWKALVSTNKIHSSDPCGDYVEVTHNGDKNETYCDVYRKTLNICYKD